jgi:hypothetical protein
MTFYQSRAMNENTLRGGAVGGSRIVPVAVRWIARMCGVAGM